MNFISQKIKDLFLIIPNLHEDERGVFRRSFCREEFEKRIRHKEHLQTHSKIELIHSLKHSGFYHEN